MSHRLFDRTPNDRYTETLLIAHFERLNAACAQIRATPPPGTMPSWTAARVASKASSGLGASQDGDVT
ncbi:MAG TPA: hypothetical protein VJV79_23375 [Polyangiaceae bacterium]|nr:hypothetical protein [Polyangiaceae bacterium]